MAPDVARPRSGTVAERFTDGAGLVTAIVGTALVVAPARADAALGLGLSPMPARALGIADVVLAPGLLRGRPRWPWMVVRTVLNAVVAWAYAAASRRPGGHRRARRGALAMTVLVVVDGGVAVVLWRSGR